MEQAFENLPSEELFRIPQERRNASFTASRPTLGFERIEHDQPEIDLTRPFTLSPYPNDGQLYRAYANKEDEPAAVGCSFSSQLTFTRVTFGFASLMIQLSKCMSGFMQRSNDYGGGPSRVCAGCHKTRPYAGKSPEPAVQPAQTILPW